MKRQIGYAILFVLLFVSGGAVSADSTRNNPHNVDSTLGTNFHFFADGSSEYPFINAFRMARPWITSNDSSWNTHEEAQLAYVLDTNGYPTRLPSDSDNSVNYRHVTTLMFTDLGGKYPTGAYTVHYDGEGVIEYGRDARLIHSGPGQDVLDVIANDGIQLRIVETNPNNHIRNIRVIMPGYTLQEAETQVFHSDFLNATDQFRILRYMDWMRTNWESADATESNDGSWSNRALPTDAMYTSGQGMPLEIMVDLANRLDADPWFNHSHLASNGDVWQFATAVRDSLNDDRFVYVEYSNEVWNYSFYQGTWIEQTAYSDNSIGDGTALQKRLSWYGKRSAELCNLWKSAWGEESDRVICTIATQAANAWVGEQMLECPLWSGSPCHARVDAVAIAPYFGQHIGHPSYKDEVKAWLEDADGGLGKLFRELVYGDVLTNRSSEHVYKTTVSGAVEYAQTYKQMADDRGLGLVTYEGGQHLVGVGGVQNDQGIHHLLMAANRDARMADMYEDYLAGWHQIGASFFVHYANSGLYSKWGYWGTLEHLADDASEKSAAIDAHIAETSCDWETCNVDNGVPTAVGLQTQSARRDWAQWWVIPLLSLVVVTALRRKIALLVLLLAFVASLPGWVAPISAENTPPAILDFHANTTSLLPGGTVLLTWETEGVDSMMLRTGTFDDAVGGLQTQSVSTTGTLLLTPDILRAGNMVVELYNEEAGLSQLIELENFCAAVWSILPPPLACPALPTVHADASLLSFEHGYMIYLPSLSAIWAFTADGSFTWDVRDTYDPLVDPFEDPNINPPLLSNFYEPTGALGKVWREEPDVCDILGWALTPVSVPYVATIQCSDSSRGGFCLLNSSPTLGFVLQFSRDPLWTLHD